MQHSDTLLEQISGDSTLQSGNSFSKTPKVWARTKQKNLVRSVKTGRYYARTWADGREIWKSLKTSHYSVAQARLAEFLREHRQRVGNGGKISEGSAKMTFADAAAIYLRNLDDDADLKPRTLAYWRECLRALLKSWPALNETEVRRITQADCRAWTSKFVKTGGKNGKPASASRFNNTQAVLKHILSGAVEAGVIYANPAAVLKRITVRQKNIALPSTETFTVLLKEMRNGHGRESGNCADLAAGLAFTGCRIGEAREMQWRDVDFEAGEIVVRGDRETGTKNWEVRRVPLISDARALFQRMRGERGDEPLDAKVFRVGICQKSLDRSCNKVGTARITHHDLRHLFATRCIESGVDIPTVSRWLGHKDGGALLMKTYGHLRREHSQAQAAKVSFAPVATKQADLIPFPAGQ
jgi:integrase